ncbi:MAG TPA: S9 family peptidase [Ktedonobacteraceae bacterium]|nr:S9 family peptidase [Ktedonobacteraceae bacterium]
MLRGVNEAAWSPDGHWIAFTAMVAPNDEDVVLTGGRQLSDEDRKKREEEERLHLRTITSIMYRMDGRGLFDQRSQLFVMPAPVSGQEGAVDPALIRRLTSGDFDCAQPGWTPDSSEISVLSNRADDRDHSFVQDLWAFARETGEARQVSDHSLQIGSYNWSPDGRSVLLVASPDMFKQGLRNTGLYLLARAGGAPRLLTAEVDNDTTNSASGTLGLPGPYRPQWSRDGERVYFVVSEHGSVNVYCLAITRQHVTPLTSGDHLIYYLALLPGERGLVLADEEYLHPWELYLLPLHATGASVGEMLPLTHLHDRQLAELTLSQPERIRYRGANGEAVDGWIVRPVGAREGVRYPLIVAIHGGPNGAYSVGMSHFFQYLASLGYAVFYCNPHGSTGSGEAFLREVAGDWGGWDFQDIMLGVDECIARGIADPERLLVTGYSYGGYMSMFIIGHTDRFKAAVPMAGVSNLESFVGTSDLGFWLVMQSLGYPWDPERAAYYRERSPITSAANVTTPTRFIHPEGDLRCPIEQTEQFYMRLKLMGKVPVELVRGPASWHGGTSKPSQYYDRWDSMLDWFGKHVEMRPEEYDDI